MRGARCEYDLFFSLILGFMPARNVEAQADRVDDRSSLLHSMHSLPSFLFSPFLSFFSRTDADNPLAGSPWSVGTLNIHRTQYMFPS